MSAPSDRKLFSWRVFTDESEKRPLGCVGVFATIVTLVLVLLVGLARGWFSPSAEVCTAAARKWADDRGFLGGVVTCSHKCGECDVVSRDFGVILLLCTEDGCRPRTGVVDPGIILPQ